MSDLSVRYIGLDLRNPFVVSSCGLTGTLKGVAQCAAAGAGAVVLKSLFEEQIEAEIGVSDVRRDIDIHPEAPDYLAELGKTHAPRSYLQLIESARKEIDIPVIASVNCVSARWWSEYARQIEAAGASALELNISIMPRSLDQEAAELEIAFYRIVDQVRKKVSLPITVKIGPYFTALPRVVDGIAKSGADGVVLFNRFYQLDVDAESLSLAPGYQFSSQHEMHLPLRWVSILAPQIGCDFAASTGIHSGTDAAKLILAGATVVQLASVLYRQGVKHLSIMIQEFESWLDRHGFASAQEACGTLAQSPSFQPESLERLQYIKALTGLG
ncbi:MAG: dihydroorotate dehydrogenase-like protein [Spirochaetaceae bacterium]|nr:MAG: dihydroorotate dehydrogenase-like protein [Spirochaetaceae bacterium]